jgi:hypothetical protein
MRAIVVTTALAPSDDQIGDREHGDHDTHDSGSVSGMECH